ncbi:MAG TPA: hypothetical protein VI036_00545 [Propionibacteriaceae bacterium]
MSDGAIDLSVPDLPTLHQRRSEKWSGGEEDVLPSTVAEMDFPLAPEITAALHAAIDRHDLGYTRRGKLGCLRRSPDSPDGGSAGVSTKIRSRWSQTSWRD